MFCAATNETCLLVLWFQCFGLLVSAVACFAVPHRKFYQHDVQYMDLICLARLWARLLVLIGHHCGMIFHTCGTIACENKLRYAIINFGQRNVVWKIWHLEVWRNSSGETSKKMARDTEKTIKTCRYVGQTFGKCMRQQTIRWNVSRKLWSYHIHTHRHTYTQTQTNTHTHTKTSTHTHTHAHARTH